MAWRITTWWKRCNEGLRGARGVSPVSHHFANFHWTGRFVFLFACVLLGVFVCFVFVVFWFAVFFQ